VEAVQLTVIKDIWDEGAEILMHAMLLIKHHIHERIPHQTRKQDSFQIRQLLGLYKESAYHSSGFLHPNPCLFATGPHSRLDFNKRLYGPADSSR